MSLLPEKRVELTLSFEESPTLFDFYEDNAFVTAVMGPVGSGKSYACAAKLMNLAINQKASPVDNIKYTRWAVVRNCFDDQTEILTEQRGFVLFKDLIAGERVAQLADDGRLEYVVPTMYYTAPYVGEMIGFEGEGVDFRVTPDHRLYVSKKRTRKQVWGDYEFKTAAECFGSTNYRVKRDALYRGQKLWTRDRFEWLGFWFAEGNVGETVGSDGGVRRRLIITQCKPDGVEYARDLFRRACIEYAESVDKDATRFRVKTSRWSKCVGNELFGMLRDCGKATTKRIPQWIMGADAHLLRAFMNGFMRGDGYVRKEGTRIACTSSRVMADQLQEIALKIGEVANVNMKALAGVAYAINGAVGVTTAPQYTVTFVTPFKFRPRLFKQEGRYRGWYREQYKGTVYCIEVPTHRVYVRRNGKAHWSSQTYGELKTTTLKTWTELWPEDKWGRVNHTPPITHHIRMPARGAIAGIDCEVMFLALDQPKDVRKLLSLNLTGFWANEVRELAQTVVTHLTRRVGRYPPMRDGGPTWRGGFMDTNPMDEDHWYHTLAEKERPRGRFPWHFYKQPPAIFELKGEEEGAIFAQGRWWKFNPEAENLANLPPGYYEQQIAGSKLDEIRCYIAGQYVYVQEGRPVWPEYDDDAMVGSPEYVRGMPIDIGLDFGLTPAAVIGQKDLRSNQCRVLAELPMFDMGLERFGLALNSLLQSKFPGAEVRAWGDPAGQARDPIYEVTAFDYLRNNCHINARPTPTNDPKTRREAGAAPMERRNGLIVHHECKFLRKALAGGYHFKRVQVSGKEFYRDVANKNQFSHIGDAFGYWCLGIGEYRRLVMNASASKNFPAIAKAKSDFDVWTI